MMYSKRHLPDLEQWGQSSGSTVIPRRARPGLAGLAGLGPELFLPRKTDKLAAGPGGFSFKAWRKERKNVHGS